MGIFFEKECKLLCWILLSQRKDGIEEVRASITTKVTLIISSFSKKTHRSKNNLRILLNSPTQC